MTKYNDEELRMINQVLLGIFIALDFSYFLSLFYSPFPWFALAGTGLGLAMIVFFWSGTKYWLFIFALLFSTALFSLSNNFHAIFS
ncbi:hypothetical protein PO902_04860 [Planococcus maritimus]|uniref:Uncharacterized protein n=1 Tax=Planococcus rifietoensis TaxID=200991 RepID=A0A0U2Q7R8_9BACL|nr:MULTISPECIES: hypothetical protein [Planococcus]ALS74822.1 hypothetical protein AUC31_06105 [Planococcus rifietoensis]MDE4084375.1 hypothetical protein [Planococcus maritimus]